MKRSDTATVAAIITVAAILLFCAWAVTVKSSIPENVNVAALYNHAHKLALQEAQP